ncbi:MAG: MBL fold metallo-hydrolase [Ruminococcus sp.]|nr:MBL fold metallo-hydrolase [Ruminococcus sp.]
MEIRQLAPLGVCQTNCYLVISESNNAVLIDAPEGTDEILAGLGDAKLRKILLTHGHFDHIASVAELAEKTGAEVFVHKNDVKKLSDDYLNLSRVFGLPGIKPYPSPTSFDDGDEIVQDELVFRVLLTPGHTSGSVCFIVGDTIFSGDTLFKGSRGRTDLVDASESAMMKSLALLRDFTGEYEDYDILSGHGSSTTLSYEKKTNPYLR